MTDLAIGLKPKAHAVFSDPARFRVLVSGRRFGKTMLAVTEMLVHACQRPGSLVWFVAPTLQDAYDTAYKPLLQMLPAELIAYATKTPLEVGLVNGAELQWMSADKSKRGRGLDLLIMDEFAFMDSEVWEAQLRPSLSDKQGRALFTTTPVGYNWAYDLYLLGLDDDHTDWSAHQYTTLEGGWVPADEVSVARNTMDPRLFRQEYEASFETLSGRVYSNFDRRENVRADVQDTNGTLYVGMDFNVYPMTAIVSVKASDECHVLAAIELPDSNTAEMAAELASRYPNRDIVVCPDPSGAARKTSAPAGQTDFTILRRAGFKVHARRSAPKVVDRINNVQANLRDANDRRRLLVHPDAHALIRGLDGLTYKEGTSQPDKSLGLDHITDALGYLLWEEFNLLQSRRVAVSQFRI